LPPAFTVLPLTQPGNMTSTENRYVFDVEWFDQQAMMNRKYSMTFFPRDSSISMIDTKNKRPFLKRSEYANITLADVYLGATVTVLARQLKIVGYGDQYTRRELGEEKGRTLAMIKPDGYNNTGQILQSIGQSCLAISRLKMIRMDADAARKFTSIGDDSGPEHAQHLSADVVVVMELIGRDVVATWQQMMGSIRDAIATDDVRNAVHGSSSNEKAAAELEFFFGEGKKWPSTALFNNCTLCIIRPHAVVKSGGEIVSQILAEGFEISAMCLFHLDKAGAEEFLEPYKGVLPEYFDMVNQLEQGPCLVMEVRQEDAVNSFRRLVGPHDPEIAKHLRPETLRAKFGLDRVRNAVHCTDLPEDGLLEVEYFFNVLYGRK